jgi:hypothetical protein
LADQFRNTVRAILRALSRKGVLREGERETLLQVMQDYPDEIFPLVECPILRETDRLGQGPALRKLLASGSNEAVLVFLKTLFPNYRVILVEVVNEAIRKIISDRRKADNENESAGGEEEV